MVTLIDKELGKTVTWRANYAVLGAYDYLDIFEATDIETAMKVSMIGANVRPCPHQVWPATEWQRFKEIVRRLPGGGGD